MGRGHLGVNWTPEKEALLKKLASEHKSMGDIAEILSLPRNSVAGKAHRLGIKFTSQPARNSSHPNHKKKRRKSGTMEEGILLRKIINKKKKLDKSRKKKIIIGRFGMPVPDLTNFVPYEPQQHSPLANSTPVELENLKSNQCSFPFGDRVPYKFCGLPTKDKKCPYCEEHEKISYVEGSAEFTEDSSYVPYLQYGFNPIY